MLGRERPLLRQAEPWEGEGGLGAREVGTLGEAHGHYLTFTRTKEKLLKRPHAPRRVKTHLWLKYNKSHIVVIIFNFKLLNSQCALEKGNRGMMWVLWGLGEGQNLEKFCQEESPVVWRNASPFTLGLEKPNQIPLRLLVGEGGDRGV